MSAGNTPLIFEPHGLFGTGLDGEDWPIGYLSTGPCKPAIALHDVLGTQSTEELHAFAALIVRAVNSHSALVEAARMVVEASVLAGRSGPLSDAARTALNLATGTEGAGHGG